MQSWLHGRRKKTQTYFNKCKGKEAGTKQTKQGLGAKEKGKGWVSVRGWVGGGGFLPLSHPSPSEAASLGKPPVTRASYCQVCSVPTVCLGPALALLPAQAALRLYPPPRPRSRGYTNISRPSSMSAPHQRLPWCRCTKDEVLTLLEGEWLATTSPVASLLPACCCSLTTNPLLPLSLSAPLIFPVSPTHFSCLCHSLRHTLESSLPHSTAILLFFFSPSWSHDGLHETRCRDYTDTDERWRF